MRIRVSEIGEFIRFQSCERRFKLGLNNRRLARAVPFSERLFNTLDPVLQEVGRAASILGRKTDIMTRDSLHKTLRRQIEETAVRVF
jgi:hypothetical protein